MVRVRLVMTGLVTCDIPAVPSASHLAAVLISSCGSGGVLTSWPDAAGRQDVVTLATRPSLARPDTPLPQSPPPPTRHTSHSHIHIGSQPTGVSPLVRLSPLPAPPGPVAIYTDGRIRPPKPSPVQSGAPPPVQPHNKWNHINCR